MKNVALLTAKGSNSTLPNKNLIEICGKPCFVWSVEAAKMSESVSEIFVSTDSMDIASIAREHGCEVIERPRNLAMPDTNHGDVILHGLDEMKQTGIMTDDACITVLLGNTVMTGAADIDACYFALRDDEFASAALTMWKAQDDHPVRALSKGTEGYMKSYLDVSPDTNRQSYTEAFYYDQGPWVSRVKTIETSSRGASGCGPWWWMGDRCLGIERPWVTGRDTHSMFDVRFSKYYLSLTDKEKQSFD